MNAGKGDKPRNCFSKEFKDNYDSIDWKNSGNFQEYLKELSKRLSDNGWHAQAIRIFGCKTKEECRQRILNHCGEEYLELL